MHVQDAVVWVANLPQAQRGMVARGLLGIQLRERLQRVAAALQQEVLRAKPGIFTCR